LHFGIVASTSSSILHNSLFEWLTLAYVMVVGIVLCWEKAILDWRMWGLVTWVWAGSGWSTKWSNMTTDRRSTSPKSHLCTSHGSHKESYRKPKRRSCQWL